MSVNQQTFASKRSFPKLRDLLALTKPGVTLLLVFTAFSTYVAASGTWFSIQDALYLLLSGSLAAGGAASINHYLERDLDGKMPRTSKRPLPSGRILQPEIALVWGLFLSLIGVALSYFMLPMLATYFIVLGIIIYIPVYTLGLKRNTIWNVVIGGAAGSMPILTAWAVARLDWPAMPFALALLVFFWTPAHFWAYAMLYESDYRKAGFPMLPSIIGKENTPPYILAHAFLAVLSSVIVLKGIPLFIAVASGMLFLAVCVNLWNLPTPKNALNVYKTSNYYLMLVFLGLFLV